MEARVSHVCFSASHTELYPHPTVRISLNVYCECVEFTLISSDSMLLPITTLTFMALNIAWAPTTFLPPVLLSVLPRPWHQHWMPESSPCFPLPNPMPHCFRTLFMFSLSVEAPASLVPAGFKPLHLFQFLPLLTSDPHPPQLLCIAQKEAFPLERGVEFFAQGLLLAVFGWGGMQY